MKFGRQFLPLSLRFDMDDLMFEKPGISSLELCTGCVRLRHIRYIRPLIIQSRQIANSVDVIGRFVTFELVFFFKKLNLKKLTSGFNHLSK